MDPPAKEGRHRRSGGNEKDTSLDPSSQTRHAKCCRGSCHAEQILQVLNSDRRDGIFTDVALVADGQRFPCHRATLSANSTYFRALFSGEPKGGTQGTVDLREISASSVGLALDYMYGGYVAIQEDNVEGLLELSSFLQISRLRDACVAFLEGQLHPFNCLGIMKFADSFSISSLAEKSKRFVLEGFVEVSLQEEFLELGVKELAACLSSQWLVVPKEEAVFEAVMRWLHHDVPSRKGALKDLLEKVRLPLLDPVYFLEKVETDALIRESKECIPLLQDARKSLILGTEVSSQQSRPRRFMEIAEMIVVIGGCDKKGILKLPFVDLFHPESGQWKALSSVPGHTKLEFATCTLRNNVYISGGHINSREVWLLNSQLNTWLRVASMEKGRWRHKMAALQGKIYAVGGYDGFCRLASVECYDAFYNSWLTVSPLPEAVSSAAVAPCLGKLYVIGGAVDDSANSDKDNCGLTACDGKIYVLGGRDESGEGTNKTFAFDPATGLVDPQLPLQRCTSYHGCVTILRPVSR
uniref:Kelch like family member 35 n=1 Tax=Salvator merianae TaxID=96440 RepID=A0A8D0BC32_SALMN